jgi:ATP-dependent Lon protease
MYDHDKSNTLRHYLKRKAASSTSKNPARVACDFDSLLDVVEIFDVEKMRAIIGTHDKKSNLHRNHQRYLDYLADTAGFLSLATVPVTIFEKLDELLLQFPNFSEVVAYYREQMALARMTDRAVFVANPLLIAGPPGVGKTAFCHALSKIVATHFELISLSGMTAGFVIGGMSSNWSEGKPGRVVEALARGHKANPLIVMDEIDKTGGDKRYDPLGPLYQLLERETSKNFVDEGLEVPTNCSHIVWVGTANEIDLIAEPIVSRFTVIDVKRPTPQQMENVLRSIYSRIRRNYAWGSQFSEDLSPAIISKIIDSGLEPRLLQRELVSACGKAVLRNSERNLISNGQHEIKPDDFRPRQVGKPEIKMGFV